MLVLALLNPALSTSRRTIMSNATCSARAPFKRVESQPSLLVEAYRATPLHIFITALKEALQVPRRR